MTELTKEILQDLAKPFPANKISIKVQTKPNDNGKSLCVAYIDARDVMARLDEVVGGDWSDSYSKAPSGGLECALTIMGVTRRDVGDDDNDNEKEKAGYSDAFKRAAVKFGIGRFLYDLPKMFASVKQTGKNFYLADSEEVRLQGIITAALNGKPLPKEQNQGKVSQPKPAQSAAPKVPNEIITNDEWQKFSELGQQATAMGINLPEYDRSKMTASTLNGASEYIKSQIKKREHK